MSFSLHPDYINIESSLDLEPSFYFSTVIYCLSGADVDNMEGSWIESNGEHTRFGYNSSSNSNSSSSSSDSDNKMTIATGDLEADEDSFSGGQFGLSSKDGPKLVMHFFNFNYIDLYYLLFVYEILYI